jgi:hypothetical protein
MRAPNLLLVILLLAGSAKFLVGGSTLSEFVRLEVSPATLTMQPGGRGVIELLFYPVDGIHVNADPPVRFSLDSAAGVTLQGKPVLTADAKTGYLSISAPVKQTLVLGNKTGPGKLKVKGTVTYFYCSDSEGWCNRQQQPVEFTILVKP